MNANQFGPDSKVWAVHEAGHAVIAEYLQVPLERARLRSYWDILRNGDLYGGSVTYLPSESPMLSERATVSVAARVAVDELLRPDAHPEAAYLDDEDCLREIADKLGIAEDDFPQWRADRMSDARRIVRIEHVREAILRVADDLQAALSRGDDGLTGEHISEALRDSRKSRTSEQ